MRNYLAVLLLLVATLMFAGCLQADQPEKIALPEDTPGLVDLDGRAMIIDTGVSGEFDALLID